MGKLTKMYEVLRVVGPGPGQRGGAYRASVVAHYRALNVAQKVAGFLNLKAADEALSEWERTHQQVVYSVTESTQML